MSETDDDWDDCDDDWDDNRWHDLSRHDLSEAYLLWRRGDLKECLHQLEKQLPDEWIGFADDVAKALK